MVIVSGETSWSDWSPTWGPSASGTHCRCSRRGKPVYVLRWRALNPRAMRLVGGSEYVSKALGAKLSLKRTPRRGENG